MSMAYDEAVATLQAMFPEWDKETLETVLTSNNYHVERTIESIFIMQGDVVSPQSEAHNAPSPSQPTQDLLFVEEQPPIRPAKPARSHANRKRRNSVPGYRGVKCDLPENFLRPPQWESHIIADEELAVMLQNEMFQREVRQLMGDDFLRGGERLEFIDPRVQAAQGRGVQRSSSGAGVGGPSRGGNINRVTPHGGNNSHANDSADLGIMKALSSMGGAAKKNLSMLAERFAASGSATGGNTGTAKEFKPLVDSGGNSNNDDEEDGDEVISFEHNKNRNSHTLHDSPTPNSEFQNPLLLNNSNYRGTNNVGMGSSMKKDK